MQRNIYFNNGKRIGRGLIAALGLSAIALVLGTDTVNAQSVGISETSPMTPSGNSLLEIRMNTTPKGLLIPRITEVNRTTLGTTLGGSALGNTNTVDTERGMLVFQRQAGNDPMGFYFWNGTSWVRLLDAGSASGWLLSGNAITDPSTQFLGTGTNQPLRIKTNGNNAFDVTSAAIAANGGRLQAHQNGTAALPLYSWVNSTGMGFYRADDNVLGVATAGTERIRIDAAGNVGIGLTTGTTSPEKLAINGDLQFTRSGNPGVDRLIYAGNPLANTATPGVNLEIRAGNSWNGDINFPKEGGDLVLQAGTGYVEGAAQAAGGDMIIRSGSNFLASTSGLYNGGDVIIQTGGPTETYVDRLIVSGANGAVRIHSLGGSGDRLVQTDNNGNISVGPLVSSFGTVTSIATGTGLTGGPITSTGTISLANMAALSVKGNATNAVAAPTDIAAANDHQVLRRSGTALGFGAVNLASSNAVTGILPVANGGTGSSSQNWVDLTNTQTAAGAKTWSDLGTFSTGVRVANGSAAAPTVSFAGSTTSGLYQQASNAVGIATAGAERVRVTNLGMGILGGVPTATQALVVVGKVKSTGINETSDARFKKNVSPISNGLQKILAMNGVTYDWRRDEFPDRNFLSGKQYGLIAQELEKVIPELVDTDEDGWKSIEYSHIVPVLIEAIKEQQAIIDGQQTELTSLKGVKEELEILKASVELISEHIRTSQK